MRHIYITILLFFLTQFNIAHAILKIDITEGKPEPLPVAIADFIGEGWEENDLGKEITEVIINDLQHSGLFISIDKAAFLENLSIDKHPTYSYWRKINASAVVAGSVKITENNQVTVQFKIWNPYSEDFKDGSGYKVDRSSWRRIAHKIADRIYLKLTGEIGYFDTRILFIAEKGRAKHRVKQLAIMDQDGANFKILTHNEKDLALTPRFDPQSQRAIYMSYKDRVPHVYIIDIEKGWQKLVGHFAGMSFAPRFSPDGQNAIMSVAQNGSTNIYEINLTSGLMLKLTHDLGVINTSPSYSPDGNKIVFNSDRGGSSQIYIMNRDGSDIQRISFGSGSYRTPVWSPRGDFIAFTKMYAGNFYIGVIKPDGNGERLLTTSWLDEGPTWSPNGRVIMFSRQRLDGNNQLYAVDITGYHERLIPTPTAASDPAWSPILK